MEHIAQVNKFYTLENERMDIRYLSQCKCGWTGNDRNNYLLAETDIYDHFKQVQRND